MKQLLNVTLLIVDCLDVNRAWDVVEKSKRNIEFGAIKILTNLTCNKPFVEKIDKISSKEEYSDFMIKKLIQYVDTDYVLVVQYDGFILNVDAWDDEFLAYDYIGATWNFHSGPHRVGNGGFSLRSRRLIKLCAEHEFQSTHPEDSQICIIHRPYLEEAGMKFAPENVANRFAAESLPYVDQFGFHGWNQSRMNKVAEVYG